MTEQKYAEELKQASNIDKIKRAVEKVNRQREVESSGELDFEHLSYSGDSYE